LRKNAWLTPNTIPDTRQCRVLSIPDSDDWVAIVTGALLSLAEERNWEEFGAVSVEDAASAMWGMFDEFSAGGCMRVGDLKASLRSGDYGDCWLVCDGAVYDVDDYPALYDEIGNAFGGVSGSTFAVPDLSGRAVVGESASKPRGSSFGEESHLLTVDEIPAHNHSEIAVSVTASLAGEVPATALQAVSGVTGSAGGGQAHNNVPPSISVTWLIKAT
jgi:microcystin-dependent protein